MFNITQVVIDVPPDFFPLLKEDRNLDPEDKKYIRVILDLDCQYASDLWFDITSRGLTEYTFGILDLKRRLKLNLSDAVKGFSELQEKGYVTQTGPNRFKFTMYPEQIVTNITEQGEGYTVYKLTFPDKKHYIGKTKQKLKDRWSNGSGYNGQEVYKAIVKYGWNNVDKKILATNLSEQKARMVEHYYISVYDSVQRGYNRAW